MNKSHAHYLLLMTFVIGPFALLPTFNQTLTAIVWLCLIIAWLIHLVLLKRLFVSTPLDLSILLLILPLPLNMWASSDVVSSLVALSRIMWGVSLFYALVTLVQSQAWVKNLLWLTALAGLCVALVGLVATQWQENKFPFLTPVYDYLPQVSMVPDAIAGQANRTRGLFHPNVIAAVLSMVMPLVYALLVFVKPRWQKLVVALILLVTSGVLLLTQSRLAIAAVMVVMLLTLTAPTFKYWRVWLIGAAIIAVAGWYTGLAVLWRSATDLFFGTAFGSWQGRLEVWRNGQQALADFVFTGTGLALFEPVSRLLYPYNVSPEWQFRHAHNNFLQTGLDFGIIGLLGYISLIIGLVWLTYEIARSATGSFRHIAIGASGSFFVYLLFGLADAFPFWVKPGFLPWFIFALVVICWRLSQANPNASVSEMSHA